MHVFVPSQDCRRFVSYPTRMIEHLLTSSEHCGDFEKLEKSLKPLEELCCEADLRSSHAKVIHVQYHLLLV